MSTGAGADYGVLVDWEDDDENADDGDEEQHAGSNMKTRMVRMLSQVVLYNANLTNLNNVTGDQVITVKYSIAM